MTFEIPKIKKKTSPIFEKCFRRRLLKHFFKIVDVFILNFGYLNSLKKWMIFK